MSAPEPFGELSPPYSTIVADPPWPFVWDGGAGGRRARATKLGYSTMSIEDIVSLPVEELAANEAHLYLWCTREVHREGHGVRVARAWGFEPVGEFIWRKRNFGAGAWPRPGHEPLLICRRGALPFTGARDVHSVADWKQEYAPSHGRAAKGHSRKPRASFDAIVSASPGPYLELFSRSPLMGWDSWGLGYESTSREAADV